jgi:poly-gamma-glutamate system protein
MIASLSAARAIQVRPVVILSLGASSYGATSGQLNLLDIYALLFDAGLFGAAPAAVSLGGEKDVGLDFDPSTRESLRRQVESRGIPFIDEPDLERNVARRMAIYEGHSGRPVAALINCGGSYASLGTSPRALELRPGLSEKIPVPEKKVRGVVFEMAARGVPVIHLLHIKGLAARYGLPWDPVPLPRPESLDFTGAHATIGARFWVVSLLYFIFLVILVFWRVERQIQ